MSFAQHPVKGTCWQVFPGIYYKTETIKGNKRELPVKNRQSGGAGVRRLPVIDYLDRFHSPINLPSELLIKSAEIGMKDEGNLPSSIDAMTRKFPLSSPGVSQKACTSTQ